MAISDKLEYLNDTKGLLKDKINNLGGSIDEHTTFRNYANQLQNVYDNLPKTEYQEGTEVKLGKTIKGKLDYENGVVGIGQSSQDSTTGNNLVGLTTTQCPVTLLAGDKITMSNTSNSEFTLNLYANYGDTSRDDFWSVASGSTRTVTLARNCGAVAWNGNITTGLCWVNKGASALPYEKYTGGIPSPNPSYDETINSVTGNQDVVVSGKNLLDKDNANILQMNLASSTTTSGSSASNRTLYIKIKPSTTYTISKIASSFFTIGTTENIPNFNMAYSQRQVNNTGTSITITTSSTANYLMVWYYNSGSDTSVTEQQILDSIMICEGTDDTYEPYITPTSYQLSLGDIELCGIGDYQDELVTDRSTGKWYKLANIGKVTLNGSETEWGQSSVLTNTTAYNYNKNIDYKATSGDSANALLNYFKGKASGYSYDEESFWFNSSGYLRIRISNTIAPNVTSLKNWLSTHNVVAYFPANTPTLTEITDTTLINQLEAWYNAHSNNGTTIITSNGNLPMIIKCRGLKGE